MSALRLSPTMLIQKKPNNAQDKNRCIKNSTKRFKEKKTQLKDKG